MWKATEVVDKFSLPRLSEGISGGCHGCRFAGVGVDVEILGVTLMLHNGLVSHDVLLRLHVGPEGIRGALGHEPLTSLDVIHTVLEVTESLAQIRSQELLDESLGVLVEELGENYLATKNLLVNSHGVLVHERGVAYNHLINKDAQCPPVDGLAVTLVQKHLRSDVLGRATKRVSAVLDGLGEAEIRKFEETILREQDILRLQIAVDDVLVVQVGEDNRDLTGVEFRVIVFEPSSLTKMGKEFATDDVLQKQIEVEIILTVKVQFDDERANGFSVCAWRRDLTQNRLLGHNMVHLLQADDIRLFEHLERVNFVDLRVELHPSAVWAFFGVHSFIVNLTNLYTSE